MCYICYSNSGNNPTSKHFSHLRRTSGVALPPDWGSSSANEVLTSRIRSSLEVIAEFWTLFLIVRYLQTAFYGQLIIQKSFSVFTINVLFLVEPLLAPCWKYLSQVSSTLGNGQNFRFFLMILFQQSIDAIRGHSLCIFVYISSSKWQFPIFRRNIYKFSSRNSLLFICLLHLSVSISEFRSTSVRLKINSAVGKN